MSIIITMQKIKIEIYLQIFINFRAFSIYRHQMKADFMDFFINFASTAGLWGCMLIPPAIVRAIYLAARLMSGNEPREQ